MIWFTSDTHFGHKNIIKYAQRPFSSVEEMNEIFIKKWNDRVKENDEIFHLGDFALCSPKKLRTILTRLKGKIYLIRGNHDQSAENCRDYFEWIKDYHELEVDDSNGYKGKQTLVLFHYAMRVWQASHYGTYHLYGHSHGELTDISTSLSFDIGVDCHDYAPINYEEVKQIMNKKNWESPKLRAR